VRTATLQREVDENWFTIERHHGKSEPIWYLSLFKIDRFQTVDIDSARSPGANPGLAKNAEVWSGKLKWAGRMP
jgi:hypothetical protein